MKHHSDTRLSTYRDIVILAGVLALYGALSWYISVTIGPFRGDPDYPYLLNGLDILVGKTPNYYDHPGTPVQTLIALGAVVTWLFALPWHEPRNVIDAVFTHPEFYMNWICAFFGAAIVAGMAFFAWSFRAAVGSMGPALIGLFSVFVSGSVAASFHQISPETLLLAGTFTLIALVIRAAQTRDDSPEMQKLAIWIGVAAAFCVTVKVTSAPVLLTLLFLPTARARKTVFLACAIASLFFLLPILSRLPRMLHGYLHILTHQGDYGTGGAGPPSLALLWQNIVQLRYIVPEIFFSLALFVLILAGARILRRPLSRNLERMLVLCVGVIIFSVLIIAKQPRSYYFIPALGFVCLGNAIAASLFLRRIPFAPLATALIIATLGYLVFNAQVPEAKAQAANWAADKAVIDRAERGGCLIVSYYLVELPEWNLYFGNLYTEGREFYPRLNRLFPNFVTYNGGPKYFETFSGVLTRQAAVKRFSHEKCVYMIGIPWQSQFGIPSASLDLVAQSTGGIALYVLKPGWEKQ